MGNRQVWLDENRASKWDSDPTARNPLRDEQVDLLLSLVAEHYISGSTIVDIGSGSGLVEEELFRRVPEALVVGVDYSPAMIALAEKRLAGRGQQFAIVRHDLLNIESAVLPERNYRMAFSVQTIHNLPCDAHRNVMSWVYNLLSAPGYFFFLDRIAVPGPELFPCYQSVWKKLNSIYSAAIDEGGSFVEHQRYLEREGDSPLTLQENLRILAESGFQASALDVRANRALIACVKTG